MEYFIIVALALLPFILSYLIPKRSKLPPGPKPWPIIGNLHLLSYSSPHRSITELSKKYGPIMSLKLGNITTIIISSSEVAKEMFTKHDLALSGRTPMDSVREANHHKFSMAWLPVCPKWDTLRNVATVQLFTKKRIEARQDVRRERVDDLVEYVRECCELGEPVDIGKSVLATTINVLSRTLFSVDLASYDPSDTWEFQDLVMQYSQEDDAIKPNIVDAFPWMGSLDFLGIRPGSSFSKMLEFIGNIVDERLEDSATDGDSGSENDDVLGNLLKLVRDDELSLKDIKHLLIDLLTAGTETTSTLLEWTMTELLHHPAKMVKAQAEIDEVLGKEKMVQDSDVSKLPYIQAIVKETLRLHPPLPFLLAHKAEENVQICGYTIPKKAQVRVNAWWIGRDPKVWTNADSFEPERFLESENVAEGQDFDLLPFGEGRRMCPGMPLAYKMAYLILANLIHVFNWKPSNGINPEDIGFEEKFGITLQRAQSLLAIPVSRQV